MKCGHDTSLCKHCWEQYLATEFDQKRKSPVMIICPNGLWFFSKQTRFPLSLIVISIAGCKEFVIEEVFQAHAGEATMRHYKSALKTVPTDDAYTSFADFCYEYDAEGILKHKDTGWVSAYVNFMLINLMQENDFNLSPRHIMTQSEIWSHHMYRNGCFQNLITRR